MEQRAREGVIVKGVGGLYYARQPDGEVHVLRAKGKFRKQHVTPMVGDRILFTPASGDEHGWVEEILPRDSELIRPPVANIRTVLLVLAPQPEPDYLLIDTLLVMAARQSIRPVLVANKCDLSSEVYESLVREYTPLQVPILRVSAKTGEGLDELRAVMRQGICCFAGQSGVGKSTLLSAATGLELKTGEISRKISRGRHTTRHAELMFQDGYQVLDTPGFSLLELENGIDPQDFAQLYPEYNALAGECRFQPCLHDREPGCAVHAAVDAGRLGAARWLRYRELLAQVRENWKGRYE